MEAYEGNGISSFSDYRYYPNKLIYNKRVEKHKVVGWINSYSSNNIGEPTKQQGKLQEMKIQDDKDDYEKIDEIKTHTKVEKNRKVRIRKNE